MPETTSAQSGSSASSTHMEEKGNSPQPNYNSSSSPDAIQPVTSTGGVITEEEYVSEAQKQAQLGYLPFKWSSLYKPAIINPVNGKSFTFPLLRFWDPYSITFWLATLGFFSAFFSWFAFAPLMPEAVKVDLKLTPRQITFSNLASLGGTAIVRIFAGVACDRFGPRNVMAVLLILGAIPSALVPTVSNIGGLETVRFFISILGGTFVPTQAWTTTFFDKTIVGTANAFSGGWGNMGGGVTNSAMIGLYQALHKAGLSPHLAWRICFLVLPVPLLIVVAAMVIFLGKDHPAGKWSQRHQLPGTAIAIGRGEEVHLDQNEVRQYDQFQQQNQESANPIQTSRDRKAPTKTADFMEIQHQQNNNKQITLVDTAVSEPLTYKSAIQVLMDLRVWMVALSYMMTFGLETALDAALPGLITTLFQSKTFTSIDAAYVASTYGLCNLYARQIGGIVSDILYRRFRPYGLGVRAKVWFMLATGICQGLLMVGLGLYVDKNQATLGGVIGFIVGIATVGFAANGAAYATYSHFRPKNIGFVAGLVGSSGNVGGLIFTAIFLCQPGSKVLRTLGRKFWIAGILNIGLLVPFIGLPLGDAN